MGEEQEFRVPLDSHVANSAVEAKEVGSLEGGGDQEQPSPQLTSHR